MVNWWKTYGHKLNPLNSIFGRLFLWFWLTTIAIILVTAFTVRHILNAEDLKQLSSQDQTLLNRVSRAIEAQPLPMRSRMAMRRLIARVDQEFSLRPVLVRQSSNQVLSLRQMIPDDLRSQLLEINDSSIPYSFISRDHYFIGPAIITLWGEQYALFLGRPVRFPIVRQYRQIVVPLAFLVSGILCFGLAWQITRPIKKLRSATQKMASGNLQVKVDDIGHRKDEIGELSADFNAMSNKVNTLFNGHKRLLADISHELRSPLTRLQLAIGIAQEQENDAHVSTALARIDKEANQINTMLEHVLQFSRLEAAVQIADKKPISVNALIQSVLEDADYEASSAGKSIENNLTVDHELMLDELLVRSALENILRNAVKYAEKQVSIHTAKEGNHLHIRISDDGPGVPEALLTQLFKPFFRVSDARQRESGGTGLGLAIAMQAIQAHDGNIIAQNQGSGGLELTIELPLIP